MIQIFLAPYGSSEVVQEVLADLKSSPELKFVADDNLRKGGQAEIGGRGFQRRRHGGVLVVAYHPYHGDLEDGGHGI